MKMRQLIEINIVQVLTCVFKSTCKEIYVLKIVHLTF